MRLVRAAQGGSREAFDALTRIYADMLRGYLRRRVGPDAADDVLQETWLASWSNLQSFRGQMRPKAWLYTIATRKCTDHQRMQLRSHTEELSEDTPGLPTVSDVSMAVEKAHAVQRALAVLPETQKEVIELYFYAEFTLPEIAAILGRNLNTVKYQFYCAHARTAEALQEYAID